MSEIWKFDITVEEAENSYRICGRCKEEKRWIDFYYHKGGSWCKKCTSAYLVQRQKANYHKRRIAGVCVECGKAEPEQFQRRCSACAAKNRERVNRHNKKRKAK